MKELRAYLNKISGILHRDGKQGDACRKSSLKKGNAVSFATVAEGRKDPRFKRTCRRCLKG